MSTPTIPAIGPTVPATGQSPSLTVAAPVRARFAEILTPEAILFLGELHHRFAGRRRDRMAARLRRRFEIGNGRHPHLRDDTAHIREDPTWRVAGAGPGLDDRRVEIIGHADPKSAIDALNCGANVWLADLGGDPAPTWEQVIGGQLTLRDGIRGQLRCTDADGRVHRVTAGTTPTIVLRPRGWDVNEHQLSFTDRHGRTQPASASLVDFGLHFFHNAQTLIDADRGPYFHLPALETSEEARLWDDVFAFSEEYAGLTGGTIRATAAIETPSAAFEMDEILFELRDHCAGLDAGRWERLHSTTEDRRRPDDHPALLEGSEATMTRPFIRACAELLVQTCHRRGAHAISGMSTSIPGRRDRDLAAESIEAFAADKRREADDGFDGTRVSDVDLVAVARAEFDAALAGRRHQLNRRYEEGDVRADHLLDLRIGRPLTIADVFRDAHPRHLAEIA